MAYYARYKEIKTTVLEFATEKERDKWVTFEDGYSCNESEFSKKASFGRMKLDGKAAMYLIDKFVMKKTSDGDMFGYTVYFCPSNWISDEFKNTDKDYIGTFISIYKSVNQSHNDIIKSLNDSDNFITSFVQDGELLVVVPDSFCEEDFVSDIADIVCPAQLKTFDCYITDTGMEKRVYR